VGKHKPCGCEKAATFRCAPHVHISRKKFRSETSDNMDRWKSRGAKSLLNQKKNKLRWYPQQPQRFIFTNLSEACCEAKRWKHLSRVSVN